MLDLTDAEKDRQRRSHVVQILNGDPAASPTRRRAQTWCSLFVAPCAPEGTPPGLHSLRPCTRNGASRRAGVGRVRCLAFLSILREYSPDVPHMRTPEVLACHNSFSASC